MEKWLQNISFSGSGLKPKWELMAVNIGSLPPSLSFSDVGVKGWGRCYSLPFSPLTISCCISAQPEPWPSVSLLLPEMNWELLTQTSHNRQHFRRRRKVSLRVWKEIAALFVDKWAWSEFILATHWALFNPLAAPQPSSSSEIRQSPPPMTNFNTL